MAYIFDDRMSVGTGMDDAVASLRLCLFKAKTNKIQIKGV